MSVSCCFYAGLILLSCWFNVAVMLVSCWSVVGFSLPAFPLFFFWFEGLRKGSFPLLKAAFSVPEMEVGLGAP